MLFKMLMGVNIVNRKYAPALLITRTIKFHDDSIMRRKAKGSCTKEKQLIWTYVSLLGFLRYTTGGKLRWRLSFNGRNEHSVS